RYGIARTLAVTTPPPVERSSFPGQRSALSRGGLRVLYWCPLRAGGLVRLRFRLAAWLVLAGCAMTLFTLAPRTTRAADDPPAVQSPPAGAQATPQQLQNTLIYLSNPDQRIDLARSLGLSEVAGKPVYNKYELAERGGEVSAA